jgi:hypothetical protein
LAKIGAGGAEQAEVVERAAAADVALGSFNLEAGLGKNRFGGGEGLRVVVVVPGVGPETLPPAVGRGNALRAHRRPFSQKDGTMKFLSPNHWRTSRLLRA